jgi:glycosyltransferase involved in cell wall biosynthesis
VLVDAWAQVHQQLPGAVLLLAGPNHHDGLKGTDHEPFCVEIEQRIAALGLQDRIRLLGMRQDVDQIYRAADLFVFPSRAEGWGTVISEAMACGLPSLLAPMDGIAEDHIRDGHEGLIVRSEDPREWAAHITELLGSPERRRQMGAQARCRVLARVSMDLVVDRYATFFRQTAGRG